jgi:hypothetical protein
MPTVCGVLKSYTYNCNFPEAGGASDELMLIPHSIIDRSKGNDGFDFNVSNPTIIENIYIKVGSQAVVVTGKRNPNAIMSTPVIEGTSTGFAHNVMFPFYEMSPDVAESLKSLQYDKVMAILRTNQRNTTGNNIYKVAGRVCGLYLSEGGYNSAENQGVTQVTLAPDEGLIEPNAMEFLFDTNVTTTNALYESLKEIVTLP